MCWGFGQVQAASTGLPGVLVGMLANANALTAIPLLQAIGCIYEHHPRPKAFIAQHPVVQQLRRFTLPGNQQLVLVSKQAQQLLNAFDVNVVF